MSRIVRPDYPDRIFSGVCAGISEYFNINLTFLRIIWILSCFAWGIGVGLYILMSLILPER